MPASSGKQRDYDYLFKLVLIGDSGVGKSCLLLRFAVSKEMMSTPTFKNSMFTFCPVPLDHSLIFIFLYFIFATLTLIYSLNDDWGNLHNYLPLRYFHIILKQCYDVVTNAARSQNIIKIKLISNERTMHSPNHTFQQLEWTFASVLLKSTRKQ